MSFRKFYQKNNFLGGEAGPLLEGRSDLVQYQLGCQKLRNFIALKGGGATRRPGTRYVDNTGYSAGAGKNLIARLMPFPIGTTESYIMELTSDGSTKTSYRTVANTSAPSIVDSQNFTSDYRYFTQAEMFEIQHAAIGRYMYLVHPTHQPIVIERTLAATTVINDWQSSTQTPINVTPKYKRLPYLPINNGTGFTIGSSATTGNGVTITANGAVFQATHVGAFFLLDTGVFQITAYTSATVVTANIIETLGSASATVTWYESAWNGFRGYPRTIAVYNQRLVMGGNTSFPDTIWFSKVGNYLEFYNGGSGAADPKSLQLASDQYNVVMWMSGGKKLAIGTSSGEWVGVLEVNSAGELNQQFNQETAHGSAYLQSKKVSYTTNFVQGDTKRVRELAFNFDSDGYTATDLNIFASHVADDYDGDKIVQLDWQEVPFQSLWAVTGSGKLFGFTRDRQQQIASWHSHVLGGETNLLLSPDGSTLGSPNARSVAVIGAPDNTYQRVFLSATRVVNGSLVNHLEWMDRYSGNQQYLAANGTQIGSTIYTAPTIFLDCMKVYSSATNDATITGMTHLANNNAYVVATSTQNGSIQVIFEGVLAVSGAGVITMPTGLTTNIAYVGLLPAPRINTLPMDGGQQPEVTPGSKRRVDRIYLRLKDTYGLKVGMARDQKQYGLEENTTEFTQLPFLESTHPATSVALQHTFTGIKEIECPGTYDMESGLAFVKEDAWPCTILNVTVRMMVNDV